MILFPEVPDPQAPQLSNRSGSRPGCCQTEFDTLPGRPAQVNNAQSLKGGEALLPKFSVRAQPEKQDSNCRPAWGPRGPRTSRKIYLYNIIRFYFGSRARPFSPTGTVGGCKPNFLGARKSGQILLRGGGSCGPTGKPSGRYPPWPRLVLLVFSCPRKWVGS